MRGNKKGDNGRVLVVGGSKEYVGALALAGVAALRSGADWVTVAAPEKVGWEVNALSPDLVVKKFKGEFFTAKHVKEVLKLSEKFDCVLIGNGIGEKSDRFVQGFVKKSKKPMVIDADAIKAIGLQDIKNAILTPHKGEFDMLMNNSKFGKLTVKQLQKKLGNNVILLKGPTDKIISKSKVAYNKTGNKGMTKAGTGDVLAGLVVGFLAQGLKPFEAAKKAAFINGKIGDLLLNKKKGYFYIASDMVEELKRIRY